MSESGIVHTASSADDNICVDNVKDIELAWLSKTVDYMNIHFNILCSVDPKVLKLSCHDDKLYTEFRKHFPDFKIDVISVESLKSEDSKKKWRAFCNIFASVIEDASFGTMLRLDCNGDYSEENTIFVVRAQFLAIEVARNREGYNDKLRELYKPASQGKEENKEKLEENAETS